jgi:hypothetical protein
MSEVTKTVADLTEALGLPESEQSAVASWCGEFQDSVPKWTEDEMLHLVEIWNETGPEGDE